MRLRDAEPAPSAKVKIIRELQEDISDLQEDKQVLGLRLQDQNQTIDALQFSWQSLEDRLEQAQVTQQQTIATHETQNEVLTTEVQQLKKQIATYQTQEKSEAALLRSENQSLMHKNTQLQRQLDAHQNEIPTEREARLLRTENEDIEHLRASIEQAKANTQKQKASLGDRISVLNKLDAEYKKLIPAQEYTIKRQKQKGRGRG